MVIPAEFKIFESLPTAVAIINSQGHVCYVNATMAVLAQVKSFRRHAGKPFVELLNIQDPLLQQASQLQSVKEGTKWFIARDLSIGGKPSVIHYSLAPFSLAEFGILPAKKRRRKKSEEESGEVDCQEPFWIVFCRDFTEESTLDDKYQHELDAKEEVIDSLRKTQKSLEKKVALLEQRVESRKVDIRGTLALRSAVLDSMGEGFFVIDGQGKCQSTFSQTCERLFQRSPEGQTIDQLMALSEQEKSEFFGWLQVVMMDSVPFSDLLGICPLRLKKIYDFNLSINFHPLRSETGTLTHLVVVAADITEQVKNRLDLENEKNFSMIISHVYRYRDQFKDFTSSSWGVFQRMRETCDWHSYDREAILMDLHTLRGSAASFHLLDFHDELVNLESAIASQREQSFLLESEVPKVRDCAAALSRQLDDIYRDLDEHLNLTAHGGQPVKVRRQKLTQWVELLRVRESCSVVRREIQADYLLRKVGSLFAHLETEVTRLSRRLNKEVANLKIEGGDLKVRPAALGQLPQVLIHLVRNSLDHGLEQAEDRERFKKSRMGHIGLSFELTNKSKHRELVIVLEDDGAGIDLVKLKERLQQQWQDSLAQVSAPIGSGTQKVSTRRHPSELNEYEIMQSIFQPGMSTRDEVSTYSGRGVGASAVLDEVHRLGGELHVSSKPHQGTRFVLTLPVKDDDILMDLAA